MVIELERVSKSAIKTAEYFLKQGWEIIPLSKNVNAQSVKKGEPIRCGDDRYGLNSPLSPAFFGGIEGIAALVHADTIEERYRKAIDMVAREYLPATHGDEHHGDMFGCAFRKAWIEGLLPRLPLLTEIDVKIMRLIHKFHHENLKGEHRAKGLLINLEPESTVIPNKKFLVNDYWYLLKLGFKLDNILHLSARTGGLVLPPEDRKLYIY